MAGSLLAGGALGMAFFGPTSAIGQTTSTTTPSNADNGGSFRSNEDATRVAGESDEREAEENSGQIPSTPVPSPPTPSATPDV